MMGQEPLMEEKESLEKELSLVVKQKNIDVL